MMLQRHGMTTVTQQNRRTVVEVEEPMEVKTCNSQLERLSQLNCVNKTDPDENSSESFDLQQEIDDPSTSIVQHQITGNEAKMLIVLENEEQMLITFEVPKEDCTVQDLLARVMANISSSQEPHVSLVSDQTLGINYIVDLNHKSSQEDEQNESESTNVEPKTPNKNSNTSVGSYGAISPKTFYSKNSMQKETPSKRGRGAITQGRGNMRSRQIKEPECLTISSDEEDDNKKQQIQANFTAGGKEVASMMDSSQLNTLLVCRTVRIGSYKYIPKNEVLLTSTGLKLEVPLIESDSDIINIDIKFENLVKVLIHFDKSMPVLFFYTDVATGLRIKDLIGMQDSQEPYFDPTSKDPKHKWIILLPEKINLLSKRFLKIIFRTILTELNSKAANDILMKT